MKHIVFSGLKHYPSGNTILTVNNNILEVIGMNRLHDGITIDTNIVKSWNISLQPMAVAGNAVFGATFNSIRKGQISKTLFQWLIMQSPDERYAYIVVNNTGSNNIVNVSGWLDEIEVFSDIYSLTANGKSWETAVVFRLSGKPLVVTDAGYMQATGKGIEKSIAVSGFVCLNGNERNVAEVDRISISYNTATTLSIDIVNQVVLSGQNIHLSILNESYIP